MIKTFKENVIEGHYDCLIDAHNLISKKTRKLFKR